MNTTLRRAFRFLPTALFGFLIGSASSASAEILIQDAFSVPDGPLVDVPGWYMGKSTVGEVLRSENKLYIKNGALVWEGSPDVTNALFCRSFATGRKEIPPVVFVGFVLNVEAPPLRGKTFDNGHIGTTFFSFTNAPGNTYRAHLGLAYGLTEGTYRLSLGETANIISTEVLPFEYHAGENVRIVLAYNSSQQVASIWINPSGRSNEPSLHITEVKKSATLSAISLRMRNHSKQDLGSFRISRLVAATTFAEAMPPL